jgi:hypothetical protein
MAARKGTRPPAAGKGRPKGARNPVAFMALVGKVLPMQTTGDPVEPLQISWISYKDAEATKR